MGRQRRRTRLRPRLGRWAPPMLRRRALSCAPPRFGSPRRSPRETRSDLYHKSSRHPRHGTPPLSLAAPLRAEAPLLIQNGGEAQGAPPAGQRELTAAGLNGTEVRWARRRRLPPRGGYVCYINKGNGRVGRQRRRRTDPSAARQVACAAAPATRSLERVSGFGSPRRSPRETRSDLNHKSTHFK